MTSPLGVARHGFFESRPAAAEAHRLVPNASNPHRKLGLSGNASELTALLVKHVVISMGRPLSTRLFKPVESVSLPLLAEICHCLI